jgi:hypothetical protein
MKKVILRPFNFSISLREELQCKTSLHVRQLSYDLLETVNNVIDNVMIILESQRLY